MQAPDVALYYREPRWRSVDFFKDLLLFFDRVAVLMPHERISQFEHRDRPVVSALREQKLLDYIDPAEALDREYTQDLANVVTRLVTSGSLASLERGAVFEPLHRARGGFVADSELAAIVFEELQGVGVARRANDPYLEFHPTVAALIRLLLGQAVRRYGPTFGAVLHPVIDLDAERYLTQIEELFDLETLPSAGHVVTLDLAVVGVDLSSVPVEEILEFRAEHGDEFRRYRAAVRRAVHELAPLALPERLALFEDREASLDETARRLRNHARRRWLRPASLAMTISGAAWAAGTGDPIGAALAGAGALAAQSTSSIERSDAYSYIFRASRGFW